jgi:hypothetical protein
MLQAFNSRVLLVTALLVAALLAGVAVISASPQKASASIFATDNNLNGGSRTGWLPFSSGGLHISANRYMGSNSQGLAGDFTANTYYINQYSQIAITATQLRNTQWIGPSVRVQNEGRNFYVGMYIFNDGNPYLQIFKRLDSNWSALSGVYYCGKLEAGTRLSLEVVGSTIALLEDGIERLAAYDAAITRGAPGIAAFGTSSAADWSAGRAGFQVNYLGTDDAGIRTYDVISTTNGSGAQELRVLTPTHPAPGVAHNFLYVLPVEPGEDDADAGFGDGLTTLQSLNAQNTYNLTIIEPSFGTVPWYANNPTNPAEQQETFIVSQLEPWVTSNLATTHRERNWLIGFSKSGYGGLDLLLRHPHIFALGAFWDFPADMSSYNEYTGSAASYGTANNFQSSYRLTPALVGAYKAPFLSENRLWIGGYDLFGTDVDDFNNLLKDEGVAHSTEVPTRMAHRWDSGWVPLAMSALYKDSQDLARSVSPDGT